MYDVTASRDVWVALQYLPTLRDDDARFLLLESLATLCLNGESLRFAFIEDEHFAAHCLKHLLVPR